MFTVMLCGASDTDDVRGQFAEAVTAYGGEPLHFLSGGILYQNSADASWQQNSRKTVHAADLCVFVIIEKYGEITFGTELRSALASGKPFIVLCHERTYQDYQTLRKHLTDVGAIREEGSRKLVAVIREMEYDWRLTITTFSYGTFTSVLRREIANLFHQILQTQQEKNRRVAVARLLGDRVRLSAEDLTVVVGIATDELEEKTLRKRAIMALADRGGVDEDTVLAFLSSAEQGVQRLAVQLLDKLYQVRPPEPEFLAQCAQVANESDDTGIVRRLIPSILRIDLAAAVEALENIDLSEVGTRRRIANLLEEYEMDIIAADLSTSVVELLARCLEDPQETGWKSRCRRLRERLSAAAPTG